MSKRTSTFALACLAMGTARAEITVDNFEPGDLVRYPVIILAGKAGGPSIAIGRDWDHAHHYPVVRGMYKAAVELLPGINMLVMQSGRSVMKYRIDYRPAATPLRVMAVWARSSDEADDNTASIKEKFDVGLKLIQSFYADAMHRAGFERKTFALDLDADGKVKVHFVTLSKPAAELRSMDDTASWSYIYGELSKQFPEATTHWCTLLGFTFYDQKAQRAIGHYALGGGSLGAFGSASLLYWPQTFGDVAQVFGDKTIVDPGKSLDDSNGRRTVWANASTALGAIAHEMGHTFGLPHAADPFSVMSRGFDYFSRAFTVDEAPRSIGIGAVPFNPDEVARWDPFQAARLNLHPYFQPDGPPSASGNEPKVEISGDSVTLSASGGIKVWGVDRDDLVPYFVTSNAGHTPESVHLSLRELRDHLKTERDFRITVVDIYGRSVTVNAPAASSL